jgi:hypothetical protein
LESSIDCAVSVAELFNNEGPNDVLRADFRIWFKKSASNPSEASRRFCSDLIAAASLGSRIESEARTEDVAESVVIPLLPGNPVVHGGEERELWSQAVSCA